ncbi:MAG: GNAT family N-acetyltransferase [Candidatus Brocadiia bacterium]
MTDLTTERLVLREFEPADWRAVQEYASDPEVVRYVTWGPNTVEETREFLKRTEDARHREPRRKYSLAVTLRRTGGLLGACGLYISRPQDLGGHIGYVLRRDAWGRGYATEAASRLLQFGFGELGLHRVFATCDVENRASAHVMEKLGMRREGRFREDVRNRGQWRDTYLYAILEGEWRCTTLTTSC